MGASLKQLQQSFKQGILDGNPSAELLDGIVEQGVSAAQRFDVLFYFKIKTLAI